MSPSVHFDVLIMGGGFAGLHVAKETLRHGMRTGLVDANGYHTFQPMLYQAASGLIARDVVAYPLDEVKDLDAVTGTVTAIDFDRRAITLASGEVLTGDYLVIASGAQVEFYGTPGASENSFPLYTVDNAMAIKSRIEELAKACVPFDIVVVGAGPTGVEISGAIQLITHHTLPSTFPAFDSGSVTLSIVDHGDVPLSHMTQKSQTYASKTLGDIGVKLHLGRKVTSVIADSVLLDDGTVLPSGLTIWAGGLSVQTPTLTPQPAIGPGGRLVISSDLRVPGYDRVYCIGDVSADAHSPLPQLGAVAKQHGIHAGKSIVRQDKGKQPTAFTYRDMGDMAMIAKGAAVVELDGGHHVLEGALGYTVWLGLHDYLLPSDGVRRAAIHDWLADMRSDSADFLVDDPQ